MKGVAQLTGRLLARKGEAEPTGHLELGSLGGESPSRRRLPQSFGNRTPVGREAAARRGTGEQAPHGSRELPQPGETDKPGKKYAFTLRLDTERHRQLRLLSARTDRSAQAILIDALDEMLQSYLEEDGGCACMRGDAPNGSLEKSE